MATVMIYFILDNRLETMPEHRSVRVRSDGSGVARIDNHNYEVLQDDYGRWYGFCDEDARREYYEQQRKLQGVVG